MTEIMLQTAIDENLAKVVWLLVGVVVGVGWLGGLGLWFLVLHVWHERRF